MRLQRPTKTVADYAAMALAPVLIMALIGSVVFYLFEWVDPGGKEERLRWILFWFILGCVLVIRIGVVVGTAQATIYGIVLAWATFMVWLRFGSDPLPALVFLGFIWWCAYKLVWDCTVSEEDESGDEAGLLDLQELGDRRGNDAPTPTARQSGRRRPVGKGDAAPASVVSGVVSSKRPHAPGLWVIYFSIGALIVFAAGQLGWASEGDRMRYGFRLLLLLIVSAIGLLMLTSFLNLRRYLRRRYLQMPGHMTAGWFMAGTVMVLTVLVGALLLPRPTPVYSWDDLAERLTVSDPPSQGGRGFDDHESDSDTEGDSSAGASEAGDGRRLGSDQGADEENGGGGREPIETRKGEDGSVLDPAVDFLEGWLVWMKWLFYAAVLGVLLWAAFHHRHALARGVQSLLEELRRWWRRQAQPWYRSRPAAGPDSGERGPTPSFRHYEDPFGSGQADQMPLEELLQYSFEALQVWASERGIPRHSHQTISEFVESLEHEYPEIVSHLSGLTPEYLRWEYAACRPSGHCRAELRRLWQAMVSGERLEHFPQG